MVFEHIEKLKQDYTDKYVIVDDSRPELLRFAGATGMVRTVNMSGRALVEFDVYDNIGWYDIDVDFLKIVEKPVVKEEPKAAAKSAGTVKPAAKGKPAAEKTSAKQMSPADILAAARGGKATGTGDKAKPAAAAAKTSPQQMSAEDILAAARGGKAAGGAEVTEKKAGPKP